MIEPRHLEAARQQMAAIERDMARPPAANSARFRHLVAEHARLRRLVELAERRAVAAAERAGLDELLAAGGDAELAAMAREESDRLDALVAALDRELAAVLAPPDPSDARNVIMEIRAGTGGEEAALFAADLYRMYARYADRRGWRLGVVDVSASDIGGYKEIVFSVEGENVFAALRFESGVHRVQRVPATEQQGRVHTSAATVAVLPEAEDVDEIEIRPEDIRMDLFRASGAGGQKVNKTESAVRLTHLPSGIVVQCQDERSQTRNKDKALRVLKARLLDQRVREATQKTAETRREQIGTGDRSERIRTYNFPQNRVTDHRINLTLHRLAEILEGDLDELIGALQARHREERLRQCLPGPAGS